MNETNVIVFDESGRRKLRGDEVAGFFSEADQQSQGEYPLGTREFTEQETTTIAAIEEGLTHYLQSIGIEQEVAPRPLVVIEKTAANIPERSIPIDSVAGHYVSKERKIVLYSKNEPLTEADWTMYIHERIHSISRQTFLKRPRIYGPGHDIRELQLGFGTVGEEARERRGDLLTEAITEMLTYDVTSTLNEVIGDRVQSDYSSSGYLEASCLVEFLMGESLRSSSSTEESLESLKIDCYQRLTSGKGLPKFLRFLPRKLVQDLMKADPYEMSINPRLAIDLLKNNNIDPLPFCNFYNSFID